MAIGFETVPIIGESFQTWPVWKRRKISLNTELAGCKGRRGKNSGGEKEGQKIINIVLKADVLGVVGSAERNNRPNSLNRNRCSTYSSTGAGEINLNDVKMARSSNAAIIGFRVKTNPDAKTNGRARKNPNNEF